MTPEDLEESRQRLKKELEEIRQKVESGQLPPIRTREEVQAARLAKEGIVDLSEAMKPVMTVLERMAQDSKEYFEWLDAQPVPTIFCNEHETTALPVNRERTAYESKMDRKLIVIYDECPKCKAILDRKIVNDKWRKMGIPEKLLGCTLENFQCETKQQNTAFGKVQSQIAYSRGFLILRGTVGTGKTHLAVGVIKHLGEGILITEADLVAELRQTYADNSGQDKMINRYRKAKVLVLDELTTEVKGVDIPQLLYRILGSRYNDNLLTVITSNETLETICTILGTRLTDRLRESLRIGTLEGDSYRKKK
jgi:DNA replication protein DnaC